MSSETNDGRSFMRNLVRSNTTTSVESEKDDRQWRENFLQMLCATISTSIFRVFMLQLQPTIDQVVLPVIIQQLLFHFILARKFLACQDEFNPLIGYVLCAEEFIISLETLLRGKRAKLALQKGQNQNISDAIVNKDVDSQFRKWCYSAIRAENKDFIEQNLLVTRQSSGPIDHRESALIYSVAVMLGHEGWNRIGKYFARGVFESPRNPIALNDPPIEVLEAAEITLNWNASSNRIEILIRPWFIRHRRLPADLDRITNSVVDGEAISVTVLPQLELMQLHEVLDIANFSQNVELKGKIFHFSLQDIWLAKYGIQLDQSCQEVLVIGSQGQMKVPLSCVRQTAVPLIYRSKCRQFAAQRETIVQKVMLTLNGLELSTQLAQSRPLFTSLIRDQIKVSDALDIYVNVPEKKCKSNVDSIFLKNHNAVVFASNPGRIFGPWPHPMQTNSQPWVDIDLPPLQQSLNQIKLTEIPQCGFQTASQIIDESDNESDNKLLAKGVKPLDTPLQTAHQWSSVAIKSMQSLIYGQSNEESCRVQVTSDLCKSLGCQIFEGDTKEEYRIGEDDRPYTKAEFQLHYGGLREWNEASKYETDDVDFDEGIDAIVVKPSFTTLRAPALVPQGPRIQLKIPQKKVAQVFEKKKSASIVSKKRKAISKKDDQVNLKKCSAAVEEELTEDSDSEDEEKPKKGIKPKSAISKKDNDEKAVKKQKDKNAPKNKRSAYLFYRAQNKDSVKKTNPELSSKELTAVFNALAAKDKDRYLKEMAAYIPPH